MWLCVHLMWLFFFKCSPEMKLLWDWVFVCIFLIAIILLYRVSPILQSCFGLLVKKDHKAICNKWISCCKGVIFTAYSQTYPFQKAVGPFENLSTIGCPLESEKETAVLLSEIRKRRCQLGQWLNQDIWSVSSSPVTASFFCSPFLERIAGVRSLSYGMDFCRVHQLM